MVQASARHRRGDAGIGAAMSEPAPPRTIPPRAGPQARRDDEGRRCAALRGAARRRRAAGTKRSLGPAAPGAARHVQKCNNIVQYSKTFYKTLYNV